MPSVPAPLSSNPHPVPDPTTVAYELEVEPVAEEAAKETTADQETANPDLAQGDMSFPVFPFVGEPFQGQAQPPAGWTVVWEPASS
uniref:Uncharacterized protein n=1 Tax=Arundo donax TaxID=35708 RepID=A0A0A9D8L2_ARUDO